MDPKACLIAMLNAAEVGYQGPDYDFAEYKNDLRQWLLNGGFGPLVRVWLPGTRTRPGAGNGPPRRRGARTSLGLR